MRADRRLLAGAALPVIALSALLSGCVTGQTAPESGPPATPLLAELATRLPGSYVSVSRDDQALQQLRVERIDGQDGRELVLRLVQRSGSEGPTRRFGLRLTATSIQTRLAGRLVLLDEGDEARRSCPMTFQAGDDGLVGETKASECVFGEGEATVGLLKEMAFDGSQLTFGDRLVDPATGQARGEDRIITFLPQPAFEGWAGRLEGDRWRVAQSFRLAPGSEAAQPLDAADMPLGVSAALAYYRLSSESDAILLRLTVRDLGTEDVLAEAWAEPGSTRIGVALPDLQVGLERQNTR